MTQLLSERLAILAVIQPQDITTTTKTSEWVDMGKFERVMGIAFAGAILGTIDASMVQATDGSGTGSKAIVNDKVGTQLSATDDDKQVVINVHSSELDTEGGFTHVALKIAGGAGGANLACGVILAGDARHGPASDSDLASVDEIMP